MSENRVNTNYYQLGLEKTANLGNLAELVGNVAKATTSTLGVAALTTFGIKSILNKIQNDTRRKALIEDLMSTDMIIKEAPKAQVLEYYATIYNLAPTISLEKPVVRELLQHFVKFGRIDMQTIKTLAETEAKASSTTGVPVMKDLIKL